MTGLDNLLCQIRALAEAEADAILRAAEAEAAGIEAESLEAVRTRRAEVLARAEAESKKVAERGVSDHNLRRRNELLTLKQELLGAVIEKARQEIAGLPAPEYFALLKSWARKTDVSGETVVHLNGEDLGRCPSDFLGAFPAGRASLSETPVPISGGFLAVCGGVTINCSVDAVLHLRADEIERTLSRILFD